MARRCRRSSSPPTRSARSPPRPRPASAERSRQEGQLHHALLERALLHLAQALDESQHAAVVGEHPGPEPADTVGIGGPEQLAEEQRAQPAALPASCTTKATSTVSGSPAGS